MSIEYGLVFTFFSAQIDIPYSILFQVTLSHFSKFKIIIGMSLSSFAVNFFCAKKKQKKRFLIAKLLRINNVIYYVRRLSVSYRVNVRTSQKMLGVHR